MNTENGKRIAIVGLGRMGARHIEAAERRGHKVTALIDPSDEPFALQNAPQRKALHRRGLKEVDPSSVDAVVIATTADLHLPLVEAAVQQGFRRFVVEKPAAQSVADAERLHDLSKAARIVVNHGRRYCEGYHRLMKFGTEKLGGLRTITLRFGGGALGCVGTHWIDLANMLAGAPVKRVFAAATAADAPNPRGARFDDPGASVMLTYQNGVVAFIDIRDDVGFIGGADFSYPVGEISWTAEFEPWRMRVRSAADQAKPLSQYGLPVGDQPFLPSETARDPGSGSAWPYSGVTAILNYAGAALDDALATEEPICGTDKALEAIRIFATARISAERGAALHPDDLGADERARRFAIP